MGCAAAKDLVDPAGDQRRAAAEGGGIEGQHDAVAAAQNPHQDAINEYRRTLENKRPQTLETYWVAGAVDSNQSPPHYVPSRGPLSIHQKLPMHFANVRKRVVTSLVANPTDLVPLTNGGGVLPLLLAGSAGAGGGGGGLYFQKSGGGMTASLGGTLNTIGGEPLPIISLGNSPMMPQPPTSLGAIPSSSGSGAAAPPAASSNVPALLAMGEDNNNNGDDVMRMTELTPSKPTQASLHHMAALVGGLHSTGRRLLRPASSSMMMSQSRGGGGGGGAAASSSAIHNMQSGAMGITAVVAAFPMPRWFALEQTLPSSERVLLEAAEGKLSVFGGTDSHGSAGSYHLARPPALDLVQLQQQQHQLPPMHHGSVGAGGYSVVAATPPFQLRAHYVLPDDVMVARAFLAQPLQNYTVGWIKVPVAPVTFRQARSEVTRGERGNDAEALVNDIRGLQQDQPDVNHAEDAYATSTQADPTASHHHASSLAKPPEGVGYLSPDKPVYNTATDGPVNAPFESPLPTSENLTPRQHDGGRDLSSSVVPFPRHLEKYYLYPKLIKSLCVTMSWKNASDLDGSFADVNLQHAFMVLPQAGKNSITDAKVDSPVGVLMDHTTTSARPSGSGAAPSSNLSNSSYFMALPVVSQTTAGELHDRVHHCIPTLNQSLLLGETSVPMYVNTPTRILFPSVHDALQRIVDHEQQNNTAEAISNAGPSAEVLTSAATDIAGLLSHDEISWLCFRFRFLEWLHKTVQSVVNAYEQNPRKEPLLSARNRLQAVHIAIRFGLKFQYDNQELLAFNEHGRSNRAAAAPGLSSPLGRHGGTLFDDDNNISSHTVLSTAASLSEYLTFIDRTRVPAVETSSIVAESQTVVLSCRLVPSAPHQPASTTFLPDVDAELAVLRVLFGKDLVLGSRVIQHR